MAELVVLTGARAGAVFELPEMPTVLGRSPEAHFRVDDPWISSMHAMFERRGSDLWVVDLESRNGTFVGEDRVQEALVRPGSVLRFGKTQVRVQHQDEVRRRSPPPPLPAGGLPLSPTRPTSPLLALDAPETAETIPDTTAVPAALPLALRTVALLRLALHLPPELPAPDAEQVRAAVEALLHAAKAEGGLTVRHCCGVVAVFGVAGPSPEDVDLALRAAHTALSAVENLGGGFTVRAALDLGSALVGNIGGVDAYELAVLGEMAERIERILAVVAPGEILAGPGASGLAGLEPAAWMQVGAEEIRVARVVRA